MKWIYKYLRADGEEIDMGPFSSEQECSAAMNDHARFGALTVGPTEVDSNYKLWPCSQLEEDLSCPFCKQDPPHLTIAAEQYEVMLFYVVTSPSTVGGRLAVQLGRSAMSDIRIDDREGD